MAFCNSCGNNLEAGARFCPKCGAAQPGSTVAPIAPAAGSPTPPPKGGSAARVVLILIAGIVALAAITIGGLTFVGLRIARHTRVDSKDGSVRVQSPFGTIESTTNPEDAARSLGVDVYPGAHITKGNAANINVAGIHTVAAEFETDDSADKVAEFYKSKFPDANVNVSDGDHYTIVSTNKKNVITINIEPGGDGTLFHIASVSGKGTADSSRD